MDSVIVAALIGAFGAIAGAVTNGLFTKRRKDRKFMDLTESPNRSVAGHWEGHVDQTKGPDGEPIRFEVSMNLEADHRIISGEMKFAWADHLTVLNVTGGSLDDRHVKLEYEDADKQIIRYGTIMLRLAADARTLAGKFVGYGTEVDGLIDGGFNARRVGT